MRRTGECREIIICLRYRPHPIIIYPYKYHTLSTIFSLPPQVLQLTIQSHLKSLPPHHIIIYPNIHILTIFSLTAPGVTTDHTDQPKIFTAPPYHQSSYSYIYIYHTLSTIISLPSNVNCGKGRSGKECTWGKISYRPR